MSFLHGVLETVKDDESVTTYDNYDALKIDKVINGLHDSVGQGRQAFQAAVSQVDTLSKKVTGGLSALIGDGKYYKEVAGRSGKELQEQLREWKETLHDIFNDLNNTETNVDLLDSALKHKLASEVRPIKEAVKVLHDSAENDLFVEQVKLVDEELVKQFSKMCSGIGELRNENVKRLVTAKRAVVLAKEMVESELGRVTGTHRIEILNLFDAIRKDVRDVYLSLNNKKVELKNLVAQAREAFGTLKINTVSKGSRSSDDKSVDYNWDMLKGEIKWLVDKVNGSSNNPNKYEGLKGIKRRVEEYAEKFRESVMFNGVVEQWITKILEKEPLKGKLAQYVNSNNAQPQVDMNSTNIGYIATVIRTHLRFQINAAVQSFNNQVEANGANNEITKNVAAVKSVCEAFSRQIGSSIGTTIRLTDIVSGIETQLRPRGRYSGASISPNQNCDLTATVATIIAAIQSESQQVSDELQSFTSKAEMRFNYDLGRNVHNAITDIDKIKQQFDGNEDETINGGSNTDFGNKIDKALEAVKEPIKKLETLLTEGVDGSIEHKLINETYGLQKVLNELDGITKEHGDDGKIKNKMNAAEDIMDVLKTKLRNQLKAIEVAVNNADSCFNHYIKILEAVVQAVQDRVTTQVRSLFTNQKLADLSALHKLVERQAKKIANIIFSDTTNGLKGLLNHMGTWLPHNKSPVIFKNLTYFNDVAVDIKYLLDALLSYTAEQVKTPSKGKKGEKEESEGSKKVQDIKSAVDKLLSHLSKSDKLYNFDYEFQQKLSQLTDAVNALHAEKFAGHQNPELLDALKKGMLGITGELGHAYVNRYDSQKFTENLVDAKYELTPSKNTTIITLRDYGRKCSKVFLTILNIAQDALSRLHYKCNGDWKNKKLCKIENNDENPLGKFLHDCGFEVAKNETSKDGELHHESVWNGKKIHEDCLKTVQDATNDEHLKACASKDGNIKVLDILKCLITHLNQYNQVCHIATFTATRTPCSIFDMLCWLSGLPHNAVFQKLTTHCSSYDTKGDTDLRKRLLDAVAYSFPNIGKYSHNMLTTIVGTGNADTIYGSDLANNSLKFKYPASAEECIHTLLDILRRLLPVCRFLYKQCGVRPSHFGWRDCQYGKNIPTAKWPCTDHSTDKANSQPTDQSTCQPTCQANDKPNCKPTCQPTSPLMSYLNDCLPGHLPHQLMSVGCMSVCSTCPSTSRNGMPCLTPFGFRAFSGSTKTGRDLCEIIKKFFTNVNLSSLFCLSPKPPVTLPEHFGFALSLVGQWADTSRYGVQSLKAVIESAIKNNSIALYDPPTELIKALTNAYGHGIEGHDECDDTHVTSLTSSGTCNSKNTHSAPYLSPLCSDAYKYLANKNAGLYLSWIAYLPWVFQQYLECLLDAFKNIFCHEWGCHVCFYNDKCKKGKHGESEHPCQCSSIAKCKGVAPTLYSYGFTFNDVLSLNASKFATKCSDFQQQLSKVTKSNYFTELFKHCDELLWKIREPFSQTLLALWSLSLLYLLHIAVVRLDVLRIRSHLRSPASHRIAAQSLLAAARVRALANVKYFSP
ncbi:hypothetical protein, conserved [Babesia ovata]|uniref:C3H1-type domain-containing protein n=1 Tax=Babesia ovata TaxID=189622 RepID=A0A2H6KK81_9APIC|nr:uncharacterized protein BOVATA_048820 [Babesia ovata]GBE63389.1 hypothetical protein, conserved [Babesia ovata]